MNEMTRTIAEMKDRVKTETWQQRIQECQQSGKGVQVWCKENGIAASTYYRYNVYKSLAKHLLDNMTSIEGVGHSGLVGNFNFTLSSFTEFPCILVETVYISTLAEEEMLADPQFRKEMMESVARGLNDYVKECRNSEL